MYCQVNVRSNSGQRDIHQGPFFVELVAMLFQGADFELVLDSIRNEFTVEKLLSNHY